jgi:hypothetical protein
LFFWGLLVAGLVLGLAWATLHFWIVPRIAEFRPALESLARQSLGIPVRIGGVSAQSTGWVPSFELRDIELQDTQGRPALHLHKVLVALSLRSAALGQLDQLVLDAPEDCRLMQEEIFGPLLPIVPYREFSEAIDYVKRRDRPLALYLFDHESRRIEHLLEHTIAGSVAINDTVLQFAQNNLPFGGIGPSGMGSYHGEAGFRTFSKEKPVFRQARWSGMALFKPPYRGLADRLVRFLTR